MKTVDRSFRVALVLLASLFSSAQAAVLYQQNFDSLTAGAGIAGQDGWVGSGAGPSLINTATQLSGNSLLGPTNNGVNSLNTFGRAISGGLSTGNVYTLSFDAFAKSSFQVTHSSGLGFGSSTSTLAGSLAETVLWVPLQIGPSSFGWRLDARGFTGNASDYVDIAGGYNTIETFELIIDATVNEVYGRYDFGSGVQETTHFSFTNGDLADIDAIAGYSDYRGQNGGATTSSGNQFSNAEYDNLVLSDNAASVPVPGPLGLILLSGLVIGALRRKG